MFVTLFVDIQRYKNSAVFFYCLVKLSLQIPEDPIFFMPTKLAIIWQCPIISLNMLHDWTENFAMERSVELYDLIVEAKRKIKAFRRFSFSKR